MRGSPLGTGQKVMLDPHLFCRNSDLFLLETLSQTLLCWVSPSKHCKMLGLFSHVAALVHSRL